MTEEETRKSRILTRIYKIRKRENWHMRVRLKNCLIHSHFQKFKWNAPFRKSYGQRRWPGERRWNFHQSS